MAERWPELLRDGRYATIGLLGEGAQGATLEAVDKLRGQPVAVKCFRVRGAHSWKDVELAEREARVLSTISHPLLPTYVDHFEEDGCLYLVMEKIEGQRLSDLKREGRTLGQQDVVRFLRDAAAALDYLHGRAPPIIHRDIKPSNVIRGRDGAFVFVDFGAVRDSLRPEGGSTVVGTFGYMAPEQFQSRSMPASDVYSVGATALSMLTGREPETLPHRGLAIDVSSALRGQVDPALVRLLQAMLLPDPDQRASRIQPLLEQLPASLERPEATAPDRAESDRAPSRRSSHARPRTAARTTRVDSDDKLPRELGRHPLALVAATLALTVGQIVVLVVLRTFLPILLTLLSVVFGPALRRGARQCEEAGRRTQEGLARATRALHDQARPWNRHHVNGKHRRRRKRVRVETMDEPDVADADHEDRHETRHRRR